MALCFKRSSILFTHNPLVNYALLERGTSSAALPVFYSSHLNTFGKTIKPLTATSRLLSSTSTYENGNENAKVKSGFPYCAATVEPLVNGSTYYSPNVDLTRLSSSSSMPKYEIEVEADLHQANEPKLEGPSQEERHKNDQLAKLFSHLRQSLPTFFEDGHAFDIYNDDVICENQFRDVTIVGLKNYKRHLLGIRLLGYLRYCWIKLELLQITIDRETYTVKARWQVRGLTFTRAFLNIHKYGVKVDKMSKDLGVHYDGFSTFYMGDDGKVYKHTISRMMPDEDRQVATVQPVKAAKLALMGFLIPKIMEACGTTTP